MQKSWNRFLRPFYFFAALPLLSILSCPQESPPPPQALIWSDDFNGSSLDGKKWNVETGDGSQYGNNMYGWGNAEKQLFKNENISVENGVLRIEVKKDTNNSTYPYSSGKITTGKVKSGNTVTGATYTVRKGRVEARMKLPAGMGFWPAFWLLGVNSYLDDSDKLKNTWPACGEIDVMEMQGGLNDRRLLGTIHFGTSYPDSYYSLGQSKTHSENLGNDWHIYGVNWDETGVRWTFDGEQYAETKLNPLPAKDSNGKTINASLANTAAFTEESGFAIIINLAVGGNFFNGNPNTVPPDSAFTGSRDARSILVDWVKVYKE
jgi:beta-glucanase (GH16 family)